MVVVALLVLSIKSEFLTRLSPIFFFNDSVVTRTGLFSCSFTNKIASLARSNNNSSWFIFGHPEFSLIRSWAWNVLISCLFLLSLETEGLGMFSNTALVVLIVPRTRHFHYWPGDEFTSLRGSNFNRVFFCFHHCVILIISTWARNHVSPVILSLSSDWNGHPALSKPMLVTITIESGTREFHIRLRNHFGPFGCSYSHWLLFRFHEEVTSFVSTRSGAVQPLHFFSFSSETERYSILSEGVDVVRVIARARNVLGGFGINEGRPLRSAYLSCLCSLPGRINIRFIRTRAWTVM